MKIITYALVFIFTLNLSFFIWAQLLPKPNSLLEYINEQIAEDQAQLEKIEPQTNSDISNNMNAFSLNEYERNIRVAESMKADIADSYHTKLKSQQIFNTFVRFLLIINIVVFLSVLYFFYNITPINHIHRTVDAADDM